MTGVTRHDPFVVLHDTALISAAKTTRVAAAEEALRAAAVVTLLDLLAWGLATGEPVNIATRTAGQVHGLVVTLATNFVVVEETRPAPRIVLVPIGEIVTVAAVDVPADQIPEAVEIDGTITLLTMLETQYRGDAVELTLTNGASVCAPVRLFGDDVLLVGLTDETLVWVAAHQIAQAAIPPPRHRQHLHTGG